MSSQDPLLMNIEVTFIESLLYEKLIKCIMIFALHRFLIKILINFSLMHFKLYH